MSVTERDIHAAFMPPTDFTDFNLLNQTYKIIAELINAGRFIYLIEKHPTPSISLAQGSAGERKRVAGSPILEGRRCLPSESER